MRPAVEFLTKPYDTASKFKNWLLCLLCDWKLLDLNFNPLANDLRRYSLLFMEQLVISDGNQMFTFFDHCIKSDILHSPKSPKWYNTLQTALLKDNSSRDTIARFQHIVSLNYDFPPPRAKTNQRECSSSLLITQKAKKQNTMQTVEVPPTQQTTETPEPVVSMNVNHSSSKRGKEKETLQETPEKTTTTIDVNATQSYVPARSIKVTEILLDYTEHRIRTKFAKFWNDHPFHNGNKEYVAKGYHYLRRRR
ncbi:9171_t:CDS:2 [Funneliformis geosporum]|nr:9171_t:CDS:2 [Funneliformis geosporum]